MGLIRVMFVGQGASGLPEDRFVNTFHFTCDGTATAEKQADAQVRVADFYNGVGTGPTVQWRALSAYLSPYIGMTCELRSYDLETAKPRTPQVMEMTRTAAWGAAGLPEEVAVCLSYHGATPITPRRRGRIYLGPLTVNAAVAATEEDFTKVGSNLYQDLNFAATRLSTQTVGQPVWCIRSTMPSENFVPIVAGYVDNAFDTQTRRGPDATSRATFTAVVG